MVHLLLTGLKVLSTLNSAIVSYHVTPVPKKTPPTDFSHFRPISVTPIMSRVTERLIVHKYLLRVKRDRERESSYAHSTTLQQTVFSQLHTTTKQISQQRRQNFHLSRTLTTQRRLAELTERSHSRKTLSRLNGWIMTKA